MTNAIRLARRDEINEIYSVHCDSVSALCGANYTQEEIAMWLDGRKPTMYLDAIDRRLLWVSIADGRMVGFVEVDGDEISKLFVRGDCAGSGIGFRLLKTAVAAIRAGGATYVYIEATRNAVEFYRRQGFFVVGLGTFSRGNLGVTLEIVKMKLSLAGH